MKKRIFFLLLAFILLLASCGENTEVSHTESNTEEVSIPEESVPADGSLPDIDIDISVPEDVSSDTGPEIDGTAQEGKWGKYTFVSEENGLSVEAHTRNAIHATDIQISYCEIRFYAILSRLHRVFVQIRVLRAPQTRFRQFHKGLSFLQWNHYVAIRRGHRDHTIGHTVSIYDDTIVDILGVKGANILLGYAFQPDSLPDAADGGVPHTTTLVFLFTIG